MREVYNELIAEAYASTWLIEIIEDLSGVDYSQYLNDVDDDIYIKILNNDYAIN